MNRSRTLLTACTALAALLAFTLHAHASAGDGRIALQPCTLPEFEGPARCGTLDVAENPDAPEGRRISLRIAVLPATGKRALPDPIVPLMGGPGEEAVAAARYFAERLATLRVERDILLVDQRGTGGSNALYCDLFEGADTATRLQHLFPPDGARRCAEASRQHADLNQYTYAHAARDLEAVRVALGYGKLNLNAGSYGTRAAQVYMRMYPKSVRTAYLGSVVPLDVVTPLTMSDGAGRGLIQLVEWCAADTACHAAFPDLARELAEMLDSIRPDVPSIQVDRPGAQSPIELPRGRILEWLRSQLYRPDTAAALPAILHGAYRGDWTPIADGIEETSRGMSQAISVGLFFAITCREDVAFIRPGDTAVICAGFCPFRNYYRAFEQQVACESWPMTRLPDGYRDPLKSKIPTMFVSGDHDAASPLWFTERVAPGFRNRVEIIARNQGHTEWSACIAQRYEQFVRTGSARRVSSADCTDVTLPPIQLPGSSR